MKRNIFLYLAVLALLVNLCACGQKTAEPIETTSAPTMSASAEPSGEPRGEPTNEPTNEPTGEASAEPSGEIAPTATPVPTATPMPTPPPTAAPTPVPTPTATPMPTPVPTAIPTPTPTPTATPAPTATPIPTATPEPTGVPIRAGTYTASDGSELTVKRDGSVSYDTEVSGTINGTAMSAVLTFTGDMTESGITFTAVHYGFLDLTEIARSNGIDDATRWENDAWALYLAQYEN